MASIELKLRFAPRLAWMMGEAHFAVTIASLFTESVPPSSVLLGTSRFHQANTHPEDKLYPCHGGVLSYITNSIYSSLLGINHARSKTGGG